MIDQAIKENIVKASILMVDDNPRNLQILGNILSQENFKVEYALNGHSALRWVEKKEFDLILLDVMMPEMDGFEFCRIFKSDEKQKNVPVIFLTAQKDMKSIVQGFELGGVDYITKPFNRQELLSRVSTHIALKKSQDIIFQNVSELEEKNKLITYSLKYGKKIQQAVLVAGKKSLARFNDFFLLFEPKDIISGDFYWSIEMNDNIILAVMDCTGHGVPGALMSMLGVTYLNEVVVSENIRDPERILNRLREKIIIALGQKGIVEEVHDGMDGVIISIDTRQNLLKFAGAYNSLYIIRNDNLLILKGDRMPVGHFERTKGFTCHQIALLENDLLYLFTDGFADQFGGKSNTKFKIQRFTDLLLKVHKLPMRAQKGFIKRKFKEWKAKQDQIDDVTVIGIRM